MENEDFKIYVSKNKGIFLKKLSLRWYLTPLKLNKINANHPNVCWKCEKEVGTYFHMWWECEKVQRFWKQIFKEFSYMCGKDIECNADIALLSIYENVECGKMTKEFITNLLTAARLIIAKQWKLKTEFQIEEWYKEIWNIAINDKLTCNLKIKKGELKRNDFYEIWGKFLEYVLIL